jgi:hypothetical protein
MLYLDGVYVEDNKYGSAMRFQWIKAPTDEELSRLTHTIAKRIGRYLERQGLLERHAEHSYLNANVIEDEQDPMHQLHGSSVTYRIAVGPRQGRKVFTLQPYPQEIQMSGSVIWMDSPCMLASLPKRMSETSWSAFVDTSPGHRHQNNACPSLVTGSTAQPIEGVSKPRYRSESVKITGCSRLE